MVKDIEFDEQFSVYADRLWEIAYKRGKEDGYEDAYEELKMQAEVNEETSTFKLNKIKEKISDLELWTSLPSSVEVLSVSDFNENNIKYYTIDEIVDYIVRTKKLFEFIGV